MFKIPKWKKYREEARRGKENACGKKEGKKEGVVRSVVGVRTITPR
jgi:hypothetical protein